MLFRSQAEEACKKLGWSLPNAPQAFAELLGIAQQEVENWEQRSSENREEQFRLAAQKKEAETAFLQATQEVQALQRQPSNIPADMLEMRHEIAAAMGISESALPFVGELIEVKPDEVEWQGAIERVLHGFALSLLVDEGHYSALTNHINNTHLGRRLVYYRTGRSETWQAKPIAVLVRATRSRRAAIRVGARDIGRRRAITDLGAAAEHTQHHQHHAHPSAHHACLLAHGCRMCPVLNKAVPA